MPISLSLESVGVCYGKSEAIRDVNINIQEGCITGIIGSNGAGKSTIMKAISGLLCINNGKILFQNERLDKMQAYQVVKAGVAQVPEGRRLFPGMTVMQNIKIGAFLRKDKQGIKSDMDIIFKRFPRLYERQKQRAETLSGGEQQMLAIGRALMARPRLLLMDEPSLGLSPIMVDELGNIIKSINEDGITVLLVEQNAGLAFKLTSYTYVLEVGKVVLEGKTEEIQQNEIVRRAFLG